MKKLSLAALAVMANFSAYAVDYTYTFNTGNGTPISSMAHGTAYTWGLSGSTYGSNYDTLVADVKTRGYEVKSASLTINNIYDWVGETVTTATPNPDPADALYINMLGGLATGISGNKIFDANGQVAGDPSWSASTTMNPFILGNAFNTTLRASGLAFENATTNSLVKNLTTGTTKTGTPADISWSDPDGPTTVSTLVFTFTGANLDALESLLRGNATVGIGFGPECHYYDTGVCLTVTTTSGVPDSGTTTILLGIGFLGLVGFHRFTRKAAF